MRLDAVGLGVLDLLALMVVPLVVLNIDEAGDCDRSDEPDQFGLPDLEEAGQAAQLVVVDLTE